MSWIGIHLNCLTHLTFDLSPLLRIPWVPYVDTWFGNLFPPWSDAPLISLLSGWLTLPLLVECLLEGAWYTYFCWFKRPIVTLFLLYFFYPIPFFQQPFPKDIRLWIPSISITLDVTLFGRDVLPNRRKRHRSTFGHHQFGIRLRLRYRLIPVRLRPQRSKKRTSQASEPPPTTTTTEDSPRQDSTSSTDADE